MTTYQLVPYVVTIHVKWKREELKVLNDYDLSGGNILDAFAGIMAAHKGLELTNPSQPENRFRVDSVVRAANSAFAVVEPGRSGIVSRLEKPAGQPVPREYVDTEVCAPQANACLQAGAVPGLAAP